MSDTWVNCTYRYNQFSDAIEIIDSGDSVRARIPRNHVIKMLGLLPPNPPGKKGKETMLYRMEMGK